jgi:ketosteroid isomerase-like protein
MPEDPSEPDLVERVRRLVEANRVRDFDAIMSFYGPDAVASGIGTGAYTGRAEIRAAYEDWMSIYEDFDTEAEEICDLGNGVVFAITLTRGRLPGGSTTWLQVRLALIITWADGQIERIANYTNADRAREMAEQLAQQRS